MSLESTLKRLLQHGKVEIEREGKAFVVFADGIGGVGASITSAANGSAREWDEILSEQAGREVARPSRGRRVFRLPKKNSRSKRRTKRRTSRR